MISQRNLEVITLRPRQDRGEASKRRGDPIRRGSTFAASKRGFCLETYITGHCKLLGVNFDKHLNFEKYISNVCSSSYFHIRALRHIRLFLTQYLPRSSPVLLLVPDSIMSIPFLPAFLLENPSSSARSKLPQTSLAKNTLC